MITLAWYNLVAIIVGILFLIWLIIIGKEEASFACVFMSIAWLSSFLIFFVLWGGIFWW
ncbi:hypothetical protein [uncultured Bacteroides sp.]|uniref:hypothetical protein n=1 Tax=uncultured Bacteroides sp. TaxID=162156 RepID=UPI0026063C5C|nr:hypothetical protein [uncultured Bacteroides sp.]